MAEAESLESTFSKIPERKNSLVIRAIRPLTHRFGQYAAPFILTLTAAACSGKEIKAETVGQPEQMTPIPPVVLQTETPLPSTQTPIIQETQAPTPTTESIPITKGEEPTPTPTSTPTETLSPPPNQKEVKTVSSFEEIKQRIEQTQASPEDKARTQEAINKFTRVEGILSQYKVAYESLRETDGTPTLLTLTEQKFNNLEKAFPEFLLEDQIFFLKDERLLKEISANLKQTPQEQLINVLAKSAQEFFNPKTPQGLRHEAYTKPVPTDTLVEFDTGKTQNPKAKEAVESLKSFLVELGLYDEIKFSIILTDQPSMGNAAGTFSASGDLPEIEIAPPFDKSTLAAEIAHLLDPELNSFLYSQLSPEEIINLWILKLKLLNNPEWGRNYPEVDLVFRKEAVTSFTKQVTRQPLTPKELVSTFIQPEDWLYTSTIDRFNSPKTPILDAFQALDKKFNQTFDQELQNRLGKYITMEEFLKAEGQFLDQIANSSQSSEWDRLFIQLFKEQAPKITYLGLLDEISIAHLRRISFISSAFEGDERVADLFARMPPQQRNQIFEAILDYYRATDNELLSYMIKAAITHQLNGQELKLETTSQNPYQEYLHSAIRFLPW